ncbi:MAG: hypothetical protein JO362_14095 [Streptomycetaceae bacterium]|nr:hypothetical protein [Streptomycetaceae bacterium]
MSKQLKVTDEGLCAVHANLTTATNHLERVLRIVKNQDTEALGAPVIADKAASFGDSWSYAVQQIGTHAQDLDKFIQKVSDTFNQLDQKLQSDMTGERTR